MYNSIAIIAWYNNVKQFLITAMTCARCGQAYKRKMHFLEHLKTKSCALTASPPLAGKRKEPKTKAPGKTDDNYNDQSGKNWLHFLINLNLIMYIIINSLLLLFLALLSSLMM